MPLTLLAPNCQHTEPCRAQQMAKSPCGGSQSPSPARHSSPTALGRTPNTAGSSQALCTGTACAGTSPTASQWPFLTTRTPHRSLVRSVPVVKHSALSPVLAARSPCLLRDEQPGRWSPLCQEYPGGARGDHPPELLSQPSRTSTCRGRQIES